MRMPSSDASEHYLLRKNHILGNPRDEFIDLDEDVLKRQEVAAYYYEHINNELITFPERLPAALNVYHLFPVLVDVRRKVCGVRDRLRLRHINRSAILVKHGICRNFCYLSQK